MDKSYDVEGMTCAACSAAVERAVKKVDGVQSVSVSLLTNTMSVSGSYTEEAIILAVSKAGYFASVKGEREMTVYQRQLKRQLIILIISVALILPLMYFSMGHMIGLPTPNMFISSVIAGVLALVVMAVNYKYFVVGFKTLFRLSPNMDTLIAIGSSVSFVFAVYSLVMLGLSEPNSPQYMSAMDGLFFDSAAMILAFVDIGKYLEALGKKKTVSALDTLIALKPLYATVLENGEEKIISAAMLKAGDIVVVKAGDAIPADGKVVSGNGAVNEAAITGESLPRDVSDGGEVTGATILESGYIQVEIVRVGEDTVISKVIKLVEEASATKAPIARVADKVSGVFVPVVLGIALVVFFVWLFIDGAVTALTFAASVLVISCPCALGLATPVAITVGLGRAAKQGILIKNAAALETVGKTKVMFFDKTGTITEGKPEVTAVAGDENSIPLVYAVERLSGHPLSKAIVAYCENNNIEKLDATDYQQFFGGVQATVEGKQVVVGNGAMFASRGIDLGDLELSGAGVLYAAVDGKIALRITLADKIKAEAESVIAALKHLGIRVVMLTGDGEENARLVKWVGIDEFYHSLKPQDKQEIISECSEISAFVGDGINDAPALTAATSGIAIGAGTDVAIEAADIVLTGESLLGASEVVKLSRKVMRTIKQNLFWAFFYNVLCIPIAAGAFAALGFTINPMIGALAMSVSSIFVVLNSLRLFYVKKQKQNNIPIKANSPQLECALKNNKCPRVLPAKENENMKTITIKGMSCVHCQGRVERALKGLGLEVEVDLEAGTAKVSGAAGDGAIKNAIEDAGYEVVSIE